MPAAASKLINNWDMFFSSSVARVDVARGVIGTVAIFERRDLPFGFVLRDAIGLLQLSGQLIALARDLIDLVVRELSPLFLHLPGHLLPVPLNAIPIHPCSFVNGPMRSSRIRIDAMDMPCKNYREIKELIPKASCVPENWARADARSAPTVGQVRSGRLPLPDAAHRREASPIARATECF